MKRNIRIFAMILALLICMGALLSCAAVSPSAPQDGEIGTNDAAGDKGFWDGVFGDSSSKDDAADAPGAVPPMEAPEGDYDYGDAEMEGGVMGGDGTVGGTNGGFEQQAGQLTGSEWNDNDHFDAFVEKINGQLNDWYSIAAKWNQVATKRIHVRVHNGQEVPVRLAKVMLLDGEGKTLYAAVTDADGDAYLFYALNPSEEGHGYGPDSIRVVSQDGKTMTHQLENGATEVTLALESTNAAAKLDVMFMIDTTGSMGDELEYLKAEMGDVIRRVAGESNVSVRTSVNFYRDKGDEYELRYFDFRADVDEVVGILAKQRASGGGDYEEAVDTALNYAVNQAKWEEDAVKLVFLVLDAPPHYTVDTVRTINEAITAAAEKGIRIIPVASSGVDTTCQVLFRTWAAMTGGTYTYLTDHSGIGGSHDKPDVEEVNVELLNNMLVRIIKEYVEGKPAVEDPDDEQKPKTALEFEIEQNVDDVDLSGYQEKYGMFGGRQYYGTGYVPAEDESGQQVDPEHCVLYTVTSYPDYADKEQHVTYIYITDPAVEVYGFSLDSSFEKFEACMRELGFEISESNEKSRVAEKDNLWIRFSHEEIRICAEVENKTGIVF